MDLREGKGTSLEVWTVEMQFYLTRSFFSQVFNFIDSLRTLNTKIDSS